MYNLLVSGDPEAWEGIRYEFSKSRLFEYTADEVQNSYAVKTRDDLLRIIQHPCLFAYETAVGKNAQVGYIRRIRTKRSTYMIDFITDGDVHVLNPHIIEKISSDLDISKYEMNRTHWALKEVDLGQVLFQHGLIEQHVLEDLSSPHHVGAEPNNANIVIVRPEVFSVPNKNPDFDCVAVMMPFREQYRSIYDVIERAALEKGIQAKTVEGFWQNSAIIQDIFDLIYLARIVICDFTGQNPNVFYEAGIAHTLGKPLIPITQQPQDIPFDLRHHRYIEYVDTALGREQLKAKLKDRISFLIK